MFVQWDLEINIKATEIRLWKRLPKKNYLLFYDWLHLNNNTKHIFANNHWMK